METKKVDFTVFQESCIRTMNKDLSFRDQIGNAALGLNGEAGEAAEVIKKFLYQGHELDKEKAAKELGDTLFYLGLFAHMLGTSLEEIATNNIYKRYSRYPNGFKAEDSIKRVDTVDGLNVPTVFIDELYKPMDEMTDKELDELDRLYEAGRDPERSGDEVTIYADGVPVAKEIEKKPLPLFTCPLCDGTGNERNTGFECPRCSGDGTVIL
jgi:NTP pyrophosphatase (non-canonical NTP hydrolase)